MSVNIQVAPPWYREGTELLAEADRVTCSAGAVLAEGRDEVIAEQILAAINGTQLTMNRAGVRILDRLTDCGEDRPITLREAGAILHDAICRDLDAVHARYRVMSTGERIVALALLYRADHAATADGWAEDLGGFLSGLSYTGGDHKRAALQLLGA